MIDTHCHLDSCKPDDAEPFAALDRDAAPAVEIKGSGVVTVGEPTEFKAALERACPRVAEAPFDAARKRMTTVHALPARGGEVAESLGEVLGVHH